ncbi:CDP-glucose 4,6-dehydratase [Neobacillus sp. Marseille-QA0830]
MVTRDFWEGKKVFITGHTGFKGTWLGIWLHSLGAKITGYSLTPPTNPSLFEISKIEDDITSKIGDIRNRETLYSAISASDPDIIFHMAAQPLVRLSYDEPIATFETNVIGTVNLFESVRNLPNNKKRAIVNITTDKCYENKEWPWGYRENDSLGGYDPYSNSKACAELVTSCYRMSFFNDETNKDNQISLASVRAGNVIGGGDWAKDRLLPDFFRAALRGESLTIRNPQATRPWQHVLEPLSGYMLLAEKLFKEGSKYAESWNFGPNEENVKSVVWVMNDLCNKWGGNNTYQIEKNKQPHEANLLKLDCSKAKSKLGWYPKWNLSTSLDKVIEWFQAYKAEEDMRQVCLKQINEFCNDKSLEV